MTEATVGIIGGGNMGGALAGGLHAGGWRVAVAQRSEAGREKLRRAFAGMSVVAEAGEFSFVPDLLILAVKPKQLQACCEAVRAGGLSKKNDGGERCGGRQMAGAFGVAGRIFQCCADNAQHTVADWDGDDGVFCPAGFGRGGAGFGWAGAGVCGGGFVAGKRGGDGRDDGAFGLRSGVWIFAGGGDGGGGRGNGLECGGGSAGDGANFARRGGDAVEGGRRPGGVAAGGDFPRRSDGGGAGGFCGGGFSRVGCESDARREKARGGDWG